MLTPVRHPPDPTQRRPCDPAALRRGSAWVQGDADKTIIRRYEFYKYVGAFNADGSGEVDCNGLCETDPLGQRVVGSCVGAQIAGFNAVQAVPEPQTWALMLADTLMVRRRR